MKKSGFSSFFSNLWYYHKWKLLSAAFLLLVIGVSVSQCVDKTEPDLSILYVGDADIGESGRKSIEKSFGGFFDDINGDGKKVLDLAFMGEYDSETRTRLQTEVLAGDHSVFFIDRENFEWLCGHGVFASLEETVGSKPENALNDYGIELKYLDIAEAEGFSQMPRNTVVCLRGADKSKIDYGQSGRLYKNSESFFKGLLSYKSGGAVRKTVDMVLIGDRDLNERCVGIIEQSLYYVCRLNDRDTAPILVYDSMQLKYENGVHVFGDEEKKNAKDLAAGDKLLLLDDDACEYLASEGMLLDLSALSMDLPESAGQYSVPLTSLPIFKADGFCYADDASNGRINLCASAEAGDYTRRVLGILYGFQFSDGG